MYDVLRRHHGPFTEIAIKDMCQRYKQPAMIFLFIPSTGEPVTTLAIDTEPDHGWETLETRTVIGTFPPDELFNAVYPYARML